MRPEALQLTPAALRARPRRPAAEPARHWVARAVGILAISRVFSLAGFAIAQHREHVPVSWSTMLQRWDGWWYVHLARDGYPKTLTIPGHNGYGPWGFFPAWPLTIRGVHAVLRVGYPMAGGIAVSCFAVCFVLLARIYAARLVGPAAADAGVLLLCLFPGTLVFSLAYTEAAFLSCSVLALLMLDSRRWYWASVAVFAACSIRSTGLAVLLAAVVVSALAIGRRWEWRSVLPPLAGLLGFALVGIFASARTGDAGIWFRAEKRWDQVFDFGHGLLVAFFQTVPHWRHDHLFWGVELVMTVVFLALLALAVPLARRLPISGWVYLVITAGSVFGYSNVGPRPRMILALFPLLLLAAATLYGRGRGWVLATGAVFAALTVLFAYLTMYSPAHVTA